MGFLLRCCPGCSFTMGQQMKKPFFNFWFYEARAFLNLARKYKTMFDNERKRNQIQKNTICSLETKIKELEEKAQELRKERDDLIEMLR